MTAFDHFAYPFAIDASAGAIAEQDDYGAYVRALILQTVMTAQGERINRPEFGASIRRLVFAPLGAGMENFVQTMVLQALDRWLGRYIRTEEVRVRVAGETLFVDIDYLVLAKGEQQFLTMEVTA
ncbi:MAG: GPW/gp25 family protein [Allosphingosinicella sp.]